MRIYLTHERAKAAPSYTVHVAPAAEPEGADGPAAWRDGDGAPVTIAVTFTHGRAEVEDALGRFMVARGYAARTNLILPIHFKPAA